MAFHTGAWSTEAKLAQELSRDRQRWRTERFARGPLLENGEIYIPSPRPAEEFKAKLKRWGLKWNGTYWHRPTTAGKEAAALAWARRIYLDHFFEAWDNCFRWVHARDAPALEEYAEIEELHQFAQEHGYIEEA